MEVGLLILGDHLTDPSTGKRAPAPARHRQFVELGVAAEALGFDVVCLGEHHLCDYILSISINRSVDPPGGGLYWISLAMSGSYKSGRYRNPDFTTSSRSDCSNCNTVNCSFWLLPDSTFLGFNGADGHVEVSFPCFCLISHCVLQGCTFYFVSAAEQLSTLELPGDILYYELLFYAPLLLAQGPLA